MMVTPRDGSSAKLYRGWIADLEIYHDEQTLVFLTSPIRSKTA